MHIYSFFFYFNRVAEGKIGIRNWAASDCKIRAQVGVFGELIELTRRLLLERFFYVQGCSELNCRNPN
ncbi:hypothetical protein BOO91_20510 [Vibrio navarrensis]|nr:hypothetical protein UF06_03745 [Vibrio sp. S234-5]MBE3654286.1 hypothetical protein [Vibrio navarrensis]MBE3663304.1 hypothetical protein [Vibrio navarrensis]MBE4605840.1 hypothetical protein [Vibrio navarrensis]